MKRGRPKKPRSIVRKPEIRQFSPRGRHGRPGYISIRFEEYEAIRLADLMSLRQVEAAGQMGISQQTFSRVLKNGRKCLAEALVRGDIIRIDGGVFKVER